MAQNNTAIDVEIFARTALRFAAKRRALAPDAVATLTEDLVQGLARLTRPVGGGAQAPKVGANDPGIPQDSLAQFCAALVQPHPEAALDFVQSRRAEGMTRHEVYLGYIAAAARQLGEGWDQNRFSLTEVTIGSGHLYALMRALRAEAQARPAYDARKCALFAVVPGEDHGIGITVAADLFREAGWEIDLQLATDHAGLLARAERTLPPVVGLSLSSAVRVPALARLVLALRLALPHAVIGVAPAAGLDAMRLDGLLDVDLVLGDADTARAELERRIAPPR